MADSLVVVESPAKTRTLKRYLGPGFTIKATLGHLKDLPKSKLGVAVEGDFHPEYQAIKGKIRVLKELKAAAKKAEKVYLALDPDREGEAIAYHLYQEIDGKARREVHRVTFNEITRKAVAEAFRNPGSIDLNKVNAQQARRILDRLVGYKISPLLWTNVKPGLSAGRVQSVALRLICEREKEIQSFVPAEYWSITAKLKGETPPPFDARLSRIGDQKVGTDVQIGNEGSAAAIVEEVRDLTFAAESVTEKERRKNPPPPFITSTLQQEASRKLRFSAAKTMSVAQRLYEGLEVGSEGAVGLITYMRTDSTRISNDALNEVRKYIRGEHGEEFLPETPNFYKSKKSAQEAHEAIRPTSVSRHPSQVTPYLGKDEAALYALIWQRFVASQMKPALYDTTTVEISAGRYSFRATGSVLKFKGFTTLYIEGEDAPPGGENGEEAVLPPLHEGETLALLDLTPKQHYTQPPPRYTEATLIRELEQRGIGRPSTYAATLGIINQRDYVKIEKRQFHPTDLGMLVSDVLVENFPDILNVEFTAKMEDELDKVEEGLVIWTSMLRDFYKPFAEDLGKAQESMRSVKRQETPTDLRCSACGREMVLKWGKNGYFLACSGYPECRNTAEYQRDEKGKIVLKEAETSSELCDKCGSPMVIKSGRFGKFLACSNYPDCKNTRPLTIGVPCPQDGCDGQLAERRSRKGKTFYSCSNYPNCSFASWKKPINKACPRCGSPYLVESVSKGKGPVIRCPKRGCGHVEKIPAEEAQ